MKKLELNQMEMIAGGMNDAYGCVTSVFFGGLAILGLAITGFASGGATVVAALGTIAANTAAGVGIGASISGAVVSCSNM